LTPDFGRRVYQPRVLRGRLADEGQPGDVMVTPELAAALHKDVGDPVALTVDAPDGSGRVVDAPGVIVDVIRGPIELGPNGRSETAWLTSGFMDRYFTTMLHAITWTLIGLGVAGALTTIAVAAQAMGRQTRRASSELPTLSALGMGSSSIRLVAMASALAAGGRPSRRGPHGRLGRSLVDRTHRRGRRGRRQRGHLAGVAGGTAAYGRRSEGRMIASPVSGGAPTEAVRTK
jgi:hypothetical protein